MRNVFCTVLYVNDNLHLLSVQCLMYWISPGSSWAWRWRACCPPPLSRWGAAPASASGPAASARPPAPASTSAVWARGQYVRGCVPGVGWRDHVQHDATILLRRAVTRVTLPLLQAEDGHLHRGGELPAPDVHREEGDPGQEHQVQQGQSLSGALLGRW